MTTRPIAQESSTLRVVAMVNGRAACPVYLYRRTDQQTPVCVDRLDLAARSERARFLEHVPEEIRAEAAPLLEQFAAQVAMAAVRAKKTTADPDPFPAVEPWTEAVDGAAVLDSVCSLLAEYMVLPDHAAEAIALWVAHTYLVDVSDYSPYLLVTSPVRECGKSTLLDLLLHVAHRAQLTGGITASALYRRIDRHAPTMLLDELDTRLRGDAGESLRGVLNTGFHRSGKVTICVGDDHQDKDFSTFSPKVLAGIGRVWDTVTSRSIPLRLARATKEQLAGLKKIRGDRISDACAVYRQQLLRFADDVREMLRGQGHDPVTPEQLGARQSDVWRPLLAIADAAGGRWAEAARAAALALHGVAEEEGDYGLLLLADVRDLFEHYGRDRLPTAVIIEALVQREDRPWPEYKDGRPISAAGLSKLFSRFGVKPKPMRMEAVGDKGARGYVLADLEAHFHRYLPTPGEAVTGVTAMGEARSGGSVTAVTDNPGSVRGAAPSADWTPGPDDVIRHPDGSSELKPEALERLREAKRRKLAVQRTAG